MKLRAVIIDDEAPARDELEHLLDEVGGTEVVARCKNGVEGIRAIHSLEPDLAFVDVNMPGFDGFEMLGLVDPDKMPSVVFVTALDDQAIRAFDEGAHDYIVKPVRLERLAKAVQRVRSRSQRPAAPGLPAIVRIPCVVRGRIRLIPPERVLGARSDHAGVHILTDDGALSTDLTLRVLEERLGLFRCHRQHAVALSSVEELTVLDGQAEVMLRGGHRAPVGRRQLKRLRQHLGLDDQGSLGDDKG